MCGETTVDVRGNGRGGRNQELAVAALEPLAALGPAALASIGTDGIDGPTDAAGAFIGDGTFGLIGPGARDVVGQALEENDTLPLLDRLGAQIAVSTTGIAGPGGGTDAKPVGTVYVAVETVDGLSLVRHVQMPGDRAAVRDRTVTAALHLVRRVLLGEGGQA